MAGFAFDEEDVEDGLVISFDWAARVFAAEHWKLNDRQSGMLARPATKLLNHVWAELCRSLPGPIARWIENTPGAMGLIIASAIVVGPRVKTQFAISRERKVERQRQPLRAAPAPARPAAPFVRDVRGTPRPGVPA